MASKVENLLGLEGLFKRCPMNTKTISRWERVWLRCESKYWRSFQNSFLFEITTTFQWCVRWPSYGRTGDFRFVWPATGGGRYRRSVWHRFPAVHWRPLPLHGRIRSRQAGSQDASLRVGLRRRVHALWPVGRSCQHRQKVLPAPVRGADNQDADSEGHRPKARLLSSPGSATKIRAPVMLSTMQLVC